MRYQRFVDSLALAAPRGLSIRNQMIAVIDTGHHRALLADLADLSVPVTLIGSVGTTPNTSDMLFPTAAVFLSATELVIVDAQHHKLDHYTIAAGAAQFLRSTDPFTGLAASGEIVDAVLDTNGTLLLLDRSNRHVIRLDPANGAVTVWLADPAWQLPSAIAMGAGYLWVADERRHRIDRYDAALQRVSFGSFGDGPGQINTPNGLLFDGSANVLYVAEGGARRLSSFDVSGTFVSRCLVPEGSRRLGKLALDNSNLLYIVDEAASGLHVVDVGSAATLPAGPFPILLDFENVLVGATRTMPFVLRNPSDHDVTFSQVNVLGEGFSLDSPSPLTPVLVPVGGQVDGAVRFAPLVKGLRVGHLRTVSNEASAPVGLVRVMGTGVEVPTFALALVLDTSGSMAQTSGSMSKIERMKGACQVLLDFLSLRTGDDLAVIGFSTNAHLALPLSAVEPSLLATAAATVSSFEPSGVTAIGAGLERAYAELANTEQTAANIIVLTDGKENWPPRIAEVPRPANVRTYSVGLGVPENIDVAKLSTLASLSGGYFQITDGSDELLSKFFLQVLADINGDQIILDPIFKPSVSKSRDFSFRVSEYERELRGLLTWDHQESRFQLEWVMPNGRVLPIERGVVRRGARHVLTSLRIRGTQWEVPGQWRLRVKCLRAAKREIAVLTVTTASDFEVDYKTALTPTSRRKGSPPEAAEAERAHRPRPHGLALPPDVAHEVVRDDVLRIDVGPSKNVGRVWFVSGVVTHWQPPHSLSMRAALNEGVDPDDIKGLADRATIALKDAPIVKKLAFKKVRRSEGGTLALSIRGYDGMHRVEIAMLFRSAQGHLVQRERTFHVLVRA